MPICESCHQEFIQSPYYHRLQPQRYCSDECRKDGFSLYIKDYMNNYWKTHPKEYEKMCFQHLSRMQKLRTLVIEHYGKKCACCGESHIEFLTIDHINGGGNRLRKSLKSYTSYYEYYRILKENYPADIQVLCMNCNFAKREYTGKHGCPVHHPEEYIVELPKECMLQPP